MSFPALTTFFDDPERNYARWAVYMALQPPVLDFVTPREKKLEVVRHRARIGRRATIEALQWLTRRGYLLDHGHAPNSPRRYTIVYALEHAHSQPCTPSRAA